MNECMNTKPLTKQKANASYSGDMFANIVWQPALYYH